MIRPSCLLLVLGLLPNAALAQHTRPAPPAPLPVGRAVASSAAWPEQPEPARIRYVGVLQSETDVGKKASGGSFFRQALTGAKPNVLSVTRPHDVFVDGRNRMYVVDAGRRHLLRFDPATRSALEIGDRGPGRLIKPMGITGTSDGTVYVADQSAKRIAVYDQTGAFVRAYGGTQVLLNPVDVAVDLGGARLYVADSYLHQVLVFDLRSGELVQRIGRTAGDLESARKANTAPQRAHGAEAPPAAPWAKDTAGQAMMGHPGGYSPEPRDVVENRGPRNGEFRFPSFVATGPDGLLAVSDALNFRVQVFDRTGKFVRAIGTQGSGPGQFARPKGVAIDNESHVYVADAAFSNIQVFDLRGRLLIAFGGLGNGDGELWMPEGLHLDSEGRVFVSDRFNNRVQIYQYLRQASAAVAETSPAR